MVYFYGKLFCFSKGYSHRFFPKLKRVVIAMEAFNNMLVRAQEGSFLLGFKVGGRGAERRKYFICSLLMTLLCFMGRL